MKGSVSGPIKRTTAIAAVPGAVSSMARFPWLSGSMLDVMVGIGQRDAIKREVGRYRMDQFPAVKERVGVAAGGDQVGPMAQGRRVILYKFLHHSADAVIDALEHRLLGVAPKSAVRNR